MFPLNRFYFTTVIRLSRLFKNTVLKRLVSGYYYNSPFHNKEHNKYCIVSYRDFMENGKNQLKHMFLNSTSERDLLTF